MTKFTVLVNSKLTKEDLWDSINSEIPSTEVVDIFETT
jgi:hypothetical protein